MDCTVYIDNIYGFVRDNILCISIYGSIYGAFCANGY